MHTGTSLSPSGPGMMPFRHRGFDQDSPSWDIHQRAALLGFEITGRDDKDTPTSVGAWKEDPDTRGDLNCANYWQADYSQRPVGCWGFGYASIITQGGGSAVSTTGNSLYGNSDTTQTSGGNQQVLPIGQNGKNDKRFKPKSPIILHPEGTSGADPNGPNSGMGGDPGQAGAGGANGANGQPGGASSGTDNGAAVNLGGGWVYQDGALAYFGPSAGQVDSLSGFNGGYWGGSLGFNFSGNGFNNSLSGLTGIPGIGFGGSLGFTFSGGSK